MLGLPWHLRTPLLTADAAGDHGQIVVADIVTNSPGGFPAGKRHPQVAVAFQGLAHQLVQRGVVELLPPQALETRLIVVGRLGINADRSRGVGGLVVWPDRARRQCRHQETRQKQLQGFHGCTSRFSALARLRACLRSM
ncbi:hypothetical protein D3C73_1279140 [compost metagenome]